jgi:hypothetical protein
LKSELGTGGGDEGKAEEVKEEEEEEEAETARGRSMRGGAWAVSAPAADDDDDARSTCSLSATFSSLNRSISFLKSEMSFSLGSS